MKPERSLSIVICSEASFSMLTPAAVNMLIRSKNCLPTYCNLRDPEYNSLIWNESFSIELMKGMPP